MVILAAVLCLPAPAEAKRQLTLPSPGHVTISAQRITVPKAGNQDLPSRFRVRGFNRRALPSSVRVLWATRVIRRRRTITFASLILAINRAERPTAGASQDDDGEAFFLYLLNGGVEGARPAERQAVTIFDAPDTSPPRIFRQMEQRLETDWMKDGRSVFDNPPPGTERFIDTGHYDDGHSFGWRPRRQDEAWNALTTSDFGREQMDEVISKIENNLGVDIDADQDKGVPACEAGSYTTTAEVEVKQTNITGLAVVDTPIPNAAFYTRTNGYAGGGGCDHENGGMAANIDIVGGGEVIAYNRDDNPLGERQQNGRWCPVAAPGEGPSNRCLIFRPELITRGNDARDAKVYSVSFGWQNTRGNDPGGSKHTVTVKVTWHPLPR
jgi:hypothetical protein